MKTPNGTKLITPAQAKELISASQLLIWYFYYGKWYSQTTKCFDRQRLDDAAYAINTQDYYHYFGYDVVLPKYNKSGKEPWSDLDSDCAYKMFIIYIEGTWRVRVRNYSAVGYQDLFIGTEAECRQFMIEMSVVQLPSWLPFKVNFKFEDDASQT
jgi:hypothetical protein